VILAKGVSLASVGVVLANGVFLASVGVKKIYVGLML
jgi:hypothetical protein